MQVARHVQKTQNAKLVIFLQDINKKSVATDFAFYGDSKLVGTLTNLLISSLSTSAFKAIKSFLATKSDVSTPVACFNSILGA